MKPVLDARKCPAMETCPAIPACPEEAISYVVDINAGLGGRIVFEPEKCNACGVCIEACCGNAIEMI